MNRNKVRKGRLSPDPLQQNPGGSHAHLMEGLTNRREARVVKRGALDVIEADDRDIARHVQSMVHERPDGADCRDVVR